MMKTIDRKLAMVRRAIAQSDDLVLHFYYIDSKGHKTERIVSLYRVIGNSRFVGFCLKREDARQFDLSRCCELKIGLALDCVL